MAMTPSRVNSARRLPGLLGSVSRFWHRSYASDYVGFALLLTSYMLMQFLVEPFHRMFSLGDLRISFPYTEVERVPLAYAFLYALFIPLAILIATNLATAASPHKHHVTVLGLAISAILTSLLTDMVKNAVGRPRPDLLARCLPAPDTPRDALVTPRVCTQTDHHALHDGWRAFPSGHSSFSFAGLGYLSLFLAGQLRIFAHGPTRRQHRRHHHHHDDDELTVIEHAEKLVRGDLVPSLLCLAPLLGAAMIAISRCQDYRHDVYDVCAGALLGWTVAYWSYRRYWPRLGSGRCHEPYAGPPLGGGGSGGGAGDGEEEREEDGYYGRLRDEEEGMGLGRDGGGAVGLGEVDAL